MKLHVEIDAAYLVLPNAKSRVAGHFYLSTYPTHNKTYPGQYNAPILTECHTLRNVVSSTAEVDVALYFIIVLLLLALGMHLKEWDIFKEKLLL